MSQILKRPYVDYSPLYGPCHHEVDGRAVSRDLCAVRSGNPKVNDKCGTCQSPYRHCQKCARENRGRLVAQPPTGDGECAECKQPKPKVVQTVDISSWTWKPVPKVSLPIVDEKPTRKKPVQVVPIRIVEKPAPAPKGEPVKNEPVTAREKSAEPREKVPRTRKEKKPALRGTALNEAIRWYREIEKGRTQREIAARMDCSDQTIHMLSKCASLPDDVFILIETRHLSMQAALAIAPFPIAVRPKLADCIGHQAFPMWQIEYIALLVQRGQGSWHGLLKERLEFVVPVEDTLES